MNRTKVLFLAIFVVVQTILAIWITDWAMGGKPYSPPGESMRPRAELEEACRKNVFLAKERASQAIARRSTELSEFIRSCKSGAQPFAKDITSWYGKWRALNPYLPFSKSDRHKEYVSQKFSEHIFSNQELGNAVKRAIESSIKDLDSIENELAVVLRQEILGRSLKPGEVPIAEAEFRKALEQMIAASQWDAAKTAASLVASEVAAQVATQVMVRLGVSAGVLATGAATSWWSFGVGLVIGVVVDVVWEWVDNPVEDIVREMATALEKLSNDAATAINEEMQKVIFQRTNLWNKILKEALL